MASIVREYILQDLTEEQEEERHAQRYGASYGPEHPQYDPPRAKKARVYESWKEPAAKRIVKIRMAAAAAGIPLVCEERLKSGTRKGQVCGSTLRIGLDGGCGCARHEDYAAVIRVINMLDKEEGGGC